MKSAFYLFIMSLLFITSFNICLLAQEDPNQFFPSSVGNVWEYVTPSGVAHYQIVKDSVLQDSSKYIYFAINSYPNYRIDTDFNVFLLPTFSVLNWDYYKLNSDSGDHWMVSPETSEVTRLEALVRYKYPSIYLGRQTTIMTITYYDLNRGDTVINEYSWPRFTEYLAYGIGEIMYIDEEAGGPQKVLRGCIIDGDTIGTIITAVEESNNNLAGFELFQNYPNPFNPKTTIKFSLSEPQKVKLSVYSLLGVEIKVLVNEYKPSGVYSVVFDGSKLPSGVYVYTLITGNRTVSKKLILLK